MSPSANVHDVDSESFQRLVVDASAELPVLVDFWAPWCAPCRSLTPVLERVVDAYDGALRLAKVDTDANGDLASAHGIRSLPTVRLFRDGRAEAEFHGAQPESAVRDFLARLVGPPAPGAVERARELIDAGRRDEAVAMLDGALGERPDDVTLRLELAAMLLDGGRLDEAEPVLEGLSAAQRDSGPAQALTARLRLAREAGEAPTASALRARVERDGADLEARYLLSLREAAAGRFEAALDGLLLVLARDRRFRDDAARRLMLDLFEIIGPGDPIVHRYRGKLFAALN